MATTKQEKQVAEEVIRIFVERGITTFNERGYYSIICQLLLREGYAGEGMRCKWRRIRPLIERGFPNKVRRAQEKIEKRKAKPFVDPEESKLGKPLNIKKEMLRDLERESFAKDMVRHLEQGHELSCPID